MHKSLLVVDWDYFFPNPMEGGYKDDNMWLYDWSHNESPLYIHALWPSRAAGFFANGARLPEVEPSWKTFPSRFNLSDDAVVYFGDSNGHAGNLSDSEGDPFSDVWLYDAHHDSGYGVKSQAEWLAKHSVEGGGMQFSCEDWMLIHQMQGAQLHWRYPTWHQHFKEKEADHSLHFTWPIGVGLDATVDDLQPRPEEFDTVFVCRSGAWVPPWEDRKFYRFVTELWDADTEQLDEEEPIRDFNIEEVKREAEAIRNVRKNLEDARKRAGL